MVYLAFNHSLYLFKASESFVGTLKGTTDYLSDPNYPNLHLPARVLVKVFAANTVEPAKRSTRLTTTDVLAPKCTLATTASIRNVSYFILSNSVRLKQVN